MERHAESMLEALRRGGVKLTPQRRAIVAALAGDPTHPTAQAIFDRLDDRHGGISFATVYNTLAKLTSLGLCREITVRSGATRFDPNCDRHHHTVCDRCGAVRDVVARDHARPSVADFEVRTVEHIYRGTCATCATAAHRNHATGPRKARTAARPTRHSAQE